MIFRYQSSVPSLRGKENPIRVALLASEMATHGGIQSFMQRIIEVMATLTPPPSGLATHCISLNDQPEELRLIPTISKLTSSWGADRSKVRLATHLLFTPKRFDTLIFGHIGQAPLALAMKMSGRLRSYFVQLHGIEAWRKVSMLERLALLGANGILATTQYTVEECARHNRIPVDRFQVIPLCANEQPAVSNPKLKLNGSFKLLCVARQSKTERLKGFEQIFQAMALLKSSHPGIHLNLVGQGDDQTRLRAVADELGVGSQVTFWGTLSNEDLAAAYEGCDAFVMPSKKEGFGIVFLEAMRLGKPCIGGNHGGTPEVVEHGNSGYLVENGDASALAEFIRTLVENTSLRRKMGLKGQALVAGKFSWQNFHASYENLFLAGKTK